MERMSRCRRAFSRGRASRMRASSSAGTCGARSSWVTSVPPGVPDATLVAFIAYSVLECNICCTKDGAMSRLENAGVSREVREHFTEVVELRRRIHQHPEPGFQEERTAALIRGKLRSWGIPFRPLCGTGTAALLEGARPGPTILIRADMDGLPIREETGLPYA